MTDNRGETLRNTMIERFGSEEAWRTHMKTIGSKGGKHSGKKGFATFDIVKHRQASAKGGRISRRSK